MKTLKLFTMIVAAFFLLLGAHNLYADTGYGKSHGMMEDTTEKSGMSSDRMHGSVDLGSASDQERQQCFSAATVVEMADGLGITFTPKGVKHENAVSDSDRVQRAC